MIGRVDNMDNGGNVKEEEILEEIFTEIQDETASTPENVSSGQSGAEDKKTNKLLNRKKREKNTERKPKASNKAKPGKTSGKKAISNVNIYKIICIILMVIVLAVLFVYGKSLYTQYRAAKAFDDLSNKANAVTPSEENESNTSFWDTEINNTESENVWADTENTEDTEVEETEEPETEEVEEDKPLTYAGILDELGIKAPKKKLDWDELHKRNEDIYAWIYIPNTKVDYPILQSSVDDEYYLNRNMDGDLGKPGCIFTQSLNTKDFKDPNTVVYGHNMRSGEMFRTLHSFEDPEFFKDNSFIYVYTEDGPLVYQIFAAYNTDDSHILGTNDFSTEEGYQAYLDKILSGKTGIFRDDINITTKNHIITLSTCTIKSNERFLVQGVLINDPELYGEEVN